jgi:hypothetical protein
VPLVNGRILARCIPGAQLSIVLGGGHLFLLEHPAELASRVADFLAAEPLPEAPAQPKDGRQWLTTLRTAPGQVPRWLST